MLNFKKLFLSVLIGVIATLTLEFVNYKNTPDTDDLRQSVSEKILRLHVIANSDSDADQAVKLKVKDAVVTYLKNCMGNDISLSDAKNIILENEDKIIDLCKKVLSENNFNYDVSMEITNCYFPIKTYGDISLPEGNYNALRITLGSASGKNWWCILYPPLCFVDVSYGIVPDDSKKELKSILNDDEYALISGDEEISFRFKYLTFLNFLFE